MSRHTPGPWVTYRDQLSVGEAQGHTSICEVWERHGGEGFENARLIAAAPDLYHHADALLADVMQRYGIDADGLTCPHMRGLAEALAKARGTA